MTPIPQLAAQVFEQRRATAQRLKDAKTWSRDEAEARLAPWAALALVCRAEVPVLAPLLEGWRAVVGDPLSEAARRAIAAHAYCPPAEMLAELARATAKALETDSDGASARALLALYLHFPDAPPLHPAAAPGMATQIVKDAA